MVDYLIVQICHEICIIICIFLFLRYMVKNGRSVDCLCKSPMHSVMYHRLTFPVCSIGDSRISVCIPCPGVAPYGLNWSAGLSLLQSKSATQSLEKCSGILQSFFRSLYTCKNCRRCCKNYKRMCIALLIRYNLIICSKASVPSAVYCIVKLAL